MEEFCGEEGVFEGTGERGSLFAAVFPEVRRLGLVSLIVVRAPWLPAATRSWSAQNPLCGVVWSALLESQQGFSSWRLSAS